MPERIQHSGFSYSFCFLIILFEMFLLHHKPLRHASIDNKIIYVKKYVERILII